MAKYLDRFKGRVKKWDRQLGEMSKPKNERPSDEFKEDSFYDDDRKFNDDRRYDDDPFMNGRYDDVGLAPTQKSESFFHYILDNKYQDLERSIRGFKDVFDKQTQQWKTIRKESHCFTDEEAEGIVRFAQGLLSADIKLASMSLEAFGKMMDLIYEQLENYFYRIAEYRYGRYGDYEKQGMMKDENKKILIELYNRVWANYSRSIAGKENSLTHESVKGQESLQSTERNSERNLRYT